MDACIENLCGGPKYTQHKQDAHKWRQMGDSLENRHKDQTTHTEEKDNLTLGCRETVGLLNDSCVFCKLQITLQRQRENIGRKEHRHQRRNEYFRDDTGCSDDTLVPKHDGGHVANWRESTTRIGSNHYQGSVDETVLLVADKFSKDHNHHDRRGQVVENGRKNKRHESNTPQQSPLRFGLERVAHEIETTILVDEFNNGHSTHQEEKSGSSAAEMVFYDLTHCRGNVGTDSF